MTEIIEATQLSTEDVAQVLDLLVHFRILASTNSYFKLEIGDMVYVFAENEEALAVYQSFISE